MKKLMIAIVSLASTVAYCETQNAKPAVKKVVVQSVANDDAAEGGTLEKPNSAKGRIAFIDTQNVVDKSVILDAVSKLGPQIVRYDVLCTKLEPGKPDQLKAKVGATVAVILVYDDETPSILTAPDDQWAVVNFKKLEFGLKTESAKNKFFNARCLKQVQRGFSLACSGIQSNYKGNLMAITNIDQLDYVRDMLPVDTLGFARRYLVELGMKPRRFATYLDACEDGWAPAPTNDVQKAIWEKVHKLPTKPITIEPEQKK